MSDAFTAVNERFGKAPAKRTLYGDKTRKAEPAQHIIEFPGGAIEVSRCSDGSYWAHIIVNREPATPDGSLRDSATGVVIGSRIDTREGIPDIPHSDTFTQVAVRIMPSMANRL